MTNQVSILVVDDEPTNFDVVETLLSDLDYILYYAASGQEALDNLDTYEPDLILLDVMMADLDGIEVCRQIKSISKWQAVPIMMVTALNTKADLARCLEVGADDFIGKPVNSIELRARVQSMLRIKRQYDALQQALTQKAALEAEKVKLLAQHNADLETKVEARTAELETKISLIQYNSLHDPLTGLPNRTLLLERIQQAIERCRQQQSLYAVLFLDIDRFKVINDSLGHLFGDRLLIEISHQLIAFVEDEDIVARFGGDEFVLLLESIQSAHEAVQIVERILDNFRVAISLDNYQFFMGMSVGVVIGDSSYRNPSDLIRDANIAMYRAKAQGTNLYQQFNAEMHAQALQRLELESDLRKALEREEFIVYYQPIVDILGDRLVGFETLIRWQHPTQGMIPPSQFIPMAEETGLVVLLDYGILQAACQQLATWIQTFPHAQNLKVSVNLSAQDLAKVSLLDDIDRCLHHANLSGEHLTLEITESMLLDDIETTIILLDNLKQRRVQISIDDFGTGFSSLRYLHRLPADYIKIDRSFVSNMQPGNRNYQVVNTIIALANQLGLTVVAEGIETPQQLQWLQALNCNFGQGYLFAPPLPAAEIQQRFLADPCPSICQSF